MIAYLGNQALLKEYKFGFLCSNKIGSRAILSCYDWATALPSDSVVVSGFHSPIERDILQILLNTGHRVIVVLARRLYATIPPEWQKVIDEERMLIVSTAPEASRAGRLAAQQRNDYIAQLSDRLVFGYVHEDSTLWPCYQKYKGKAERLFCDNRK
ncbi:DNA-processing protein DprA [Porphyromonas gulae]|uniref:DNA-processing protein DprA n=1 Tax=Porphyromonas gulae TaxID=111105 RepID=UPI00068F931F|nr:DNA-processing protein DprA [Porphyromonas gulae]